MLFVIEYARDDNGTLFATAPQFPEVTTFGEDVPQVCVHALDAIEEAIAARMAAGEDLPAPAAGRRLKGVDAGQGGRTWVKLPSLTALKVELYRAIRAANINRAELARRLGWKRESVDRLFRLDHRSRLEQIEAAFDALGREVEVTVGTSQRALRERQPDEASR